jgi:hypothetical protein
MLDDVLAIAFESQTFISEPQPISPDAAKFNVEPLNITFRTSEHHPRISEHH